MYPNPATSSVTVEFVAAEKTENATIQVLDMVGRVVLSQHKTVTEGSNYETLDLANLPQGAYCVRTAVGELIYTTKITVQ